MPTYEYECESCGYCFDAFQGIKENPLETCPVCNEKIHRIINGGAGLIFKGSGFYVTDYKNTGSSGNGRHKKAQSGTDNKDASDNKNDSKK
ncbi:FmdB family zinc ribbon protein [candidate division KSB1 bacterium]